MNEALARNMTINELLPFAEQELSNLELVLAHPPVAVTELVKQRTPWLMSWAAPIESVMDEHDFGTPADLCGYVEKTAEILSDFELTDLDELRGQLKQLHEILEENDLDLTDLGAELTRLKTLAHRIEQACNDAGIEINC